MEKINKRWVLAKRPEGMPEDECWKLEEASIKDLDEKFLHISLERQLLKYLRLMWNNQ